MKAAFSAALFLVAGLALLRGGVAYGPYDNNYDGAGCLKEDVGGNGIRKEQGFVLVGSQFFTCLHGYKPAYGSQAKATCQPNGYWSIDIDCVPVAYTSDPVYQQRKLLQDAPPAASGGGDSCGGSRKLSQDSSFAPPPGSDLNCGRKLLAPVGIVGEPVGVLAPWGQCGGRSAECHLGDFHCVDAKWDNMSCPPGQTCFRQSEYYWQCQPKKEGSYYSRH